MSSNSDSDSDDDGVPAFLRAGVTFICEEEDDEDHNISTNNTNSINNGGGISSDSSGSGGISGGRNNGNGHVEMMVKDEFCLRVETLYLHRDIDGLTKEYESYQHQHQQYDLQGNCIQIAIHLLSGQFQEIVQHHFPTSLQLNSMLDEIINNTNAADALNRRVCAYVSTGDSAFNRELRALQCMLLGTACLSFYCQMNYTGPELPERDLQVWYRISPHEKGDIDPARMELIHKSAINCLECDGDVAFPICVIPQALFISRVLLSTIADPLRASWKHGIELTPSGQILKSLTTIRPDQRVIAACHRLQSKWWRSGRAAVIHLRLLQKQTFEMMPTLWKECNDMFAMSAVNYGCIDLNDVDTSEASVLNDSLLTIQLMASRPCRDGVSIADRLIGAELWLEIGLSQHFFEYKSKGKEYFRKSQQVVGVEAQLTSALGKRTKYQQTAHLQLFLIARSRVAQLVGTAGAEPAKKEYKLVSISGQETRELLAAEDAATVEEGPTEGTAGTSEGGSTDPTSANAGGWQHAEWELGRKLVGEVEGGEVAAVREVMLDSQDGGAVENILIEGGPKFMEDQDRGGPLHPVDQAVLMSLCLDVSNSNPVDGLTNEEMYPYVERVMQQPLNWMVHSTALLQRSWLEFERRKTMDRALLQMQALLDQHTTKLTITQSTYKSVEESAPAQDRLLYLHALVYPAQYELKRDLAMRYLRCQVYSSALNYFKELEMWDEVVTCYQLMDKPQRAELVVRERLRLGETPYMLTALGDLTQSEECYERAWILSNRRYARAKRTLARMCFDKRDYQSCVRHMDEALKVHPLIPTAWYLKGLACMHLEDWPNSIQAFSRCVQQDMEIGEAWANIGAVYMRQGLMSQAHEALVQALRQKRDSWQVLENLMTCCIALGRWRELVDYMHALLDAKLRKKSGTNVYKPELRRLVRAAIDDGLLAQKLAAAAASGDASSAVTTETSPVAGEHSSQEDDVQFMQAPVVLSDEADLSSGVAGASLEPQTTTREPSVVTTGKLKLAVEKLLTAISAAVDSDAELWDIIAEFYFAFQVPEKVEESRVKQFRALLQKPHWEKEVSNIETLATASKQLLGAHQRADISRPSVYACRSLIQTAVQKCAAFYEDLPLPEAVLELKADLAVVEAQYNSMT